MWLGTVCISLLDLENNILPLTSISPAITGISSYHRQVYSLRHVKWIKIKIIPPAIFASPTSILDCSTMENVPPTREKGKHLSDIDIGKILRLAKADMPQRKIASLMKTALHTIQNILATYLFETFHGRNPRRNYPRKHPNVKIDTFYALYNKTMTFPFKILPIKLASEFLKQLFGNGDRKQVWEVTLQ